MAFSNVQQGCREICPLAALEDHSVATRKRIQCNHYAHVILIMSTSVVLNSMGAFAPFSHVCANS